VNTNATNIASINTNASNISDIQDAFTNATNAANSAAAAAASANAAAASASAGLYAAVQDKSANYTIVAGDEGDLIQVDTSSGNITITLTALATIGADFKVAVAKMTSDSNTVTIQRSGSDTINGGTSFVLDTQYDTVNLVGDLSDNAWLALGGLATGLSGGNGIDFAGGVISLANITDNGTGTVLTFDGSNNVTCAAAVLPTTTNTQDLGASGNVWANVWATTINGTSTSAQYADLAELYEATTELEPGTVVRFGGSAEIEPTTSTEDTRVFGVVSTDPGYLMNSGREGHWYPVALTGRCPVKVIGPVQKFDLLVPSSIPGHAEAAPESMKDYAIGRSLEDKASADAGVIEARVHAH
jgi:hypothetical protein